MLGLAWLAWNIWFPAKVVPQQIDVKVWLAERPSLGNLEQERWRVFTKRMVWDQAVEQLKTLFKEHHMEPMILSRKEAVQLHVFDDPRTFVSYTDAQAALKEWNVESADILRKSDGQYMLGLGRFYLNEYAEQRHHELKKLGKEFVYSQETKIIPTYRFIFPALPEAEAEILWKNIQAMGAIDPVMMTENEFNAMFVGSM